MYPGSLTPHGPALAQLADLLAGENPLGIPLDVMSAPVTIYVHPASGRIHGDAQHETGTVETHTTLAHLDRSARCKCATINRIGGPDAVEVAELAQVLIAADADITRIDRGDPQHPVATRDLASRRRDVLTTMSERASNAHIGAAYRTLAQRFADLAVQADVHVHAPELRQRLTREAASIALAGRVDGPLADLHRLTDYLGGRSPHLPGDEDTYDRPWQDATRTRLAGANPVTVTQIAAIDPARLVRHLQQSGDLLHQRHEAITAAWREQAILMVDAIPDWWSEEIATLLDDHRPYLVLTHGNEWGAVYDEHTAVFGTGVAGLLRGPRAVAEMHRTRGASIAVDPGLAADAWEILSALVADAQHDDGDLDLPQLIATAVALSQE